MTDRYPTILAFLTAARERGLKWPRLTLTDDDGRVVEFRLAGAGAAQPGSITVTNGIKYREPGAVFYGRIRADGDADLRNSEVGQILPLLAEIEADPVQALTERGKRTGRCQFCHAELTVDESLAAGCGQTCASRWGVPWGKKSSAGAATIDQDAAQAQALAEARGRAIAALNACTDLDRIADAEYLIREGGLPLTGGNPYRVDDPAREAEIQAQAEASQVELVTIVQEDEPTVPPHREDGEHHSETLAAVLDAEAEAEASEAQAQAPGSLGDVASFWDPPF